MIKEGSFGPGQPLEDGAGNDCCEKGSEAELQHLIFGLLKFDTVNYINQFGWESVSKYFLSQGFEVIWKMRPVLMSTDFWLKHYGNTILAKERQHAGDGERYRRKITERLSNTLAMPVLIARLGTDKHDLVSRDELRVLKQQVRKSISAIFTHEEGVRRRESGEEPSSAAARGARAESCGTGGTDDDDLDDSMSSGAGAVNDSADDQGRWAYDSLTYDPDQKHQLLHMSDDTCAARDEMEVLLAYLQTPAIYAELSADQAKEFEFYLEAEVLPKLKACLEFISSGNHNHSCKKLRETLGECV